MSIIVTQLMYYSNLIMSWDKNNYQLKNRRMIEIKLYKISKYVGKGFTIEGRTPIYTITKLYKDKNTNLTSYNNIYIEEDFREFFS